MNLLRKSLLVTLCFMLLQFPLHATSDSDKGVKSKIQKAMSDISIEDLVLIGGTGFLMTELLATCPHKHDVWPFLASGGYLLVSELTNEKSFRFNSDQIEEEIKRSKGDQNKQIAALEGAYKITNNAANAAKVRGQNYKTASIGFGLAAATAFTRAYLAAPGKAKLLSATGLARA